MDSRREHKFLNVIRSPFPDEDGAILTVALIFVGILALVGATATLITTTDTKIGANYKASGKALYVAEAGAQEARQRLRGLTPSISDNGNTGNALWKTYIKTDIGTIENCKAKGYNESDTNHHIVDSLQTGMDYTVVITHQTDDQTDGGNVLYWGDVNEDGNEDGVFERTTTVSEKNMNIYLITSYGTAEGSTKTVQLEVTRLPPITVKGALYSGTSSTIKGSVAIDGKDSCGGSPKPGIATPTLSSSPVSFIGSAESTGDPEYGDPTNVKYAEDPALVVQSMADLIKKSADFSYSVNSATSYSATTIPGPGDGWGTPDFAAVPPTCSSCNIVHYDTNNTAISFSGSISGCGILVVEGDLNITGGFKWYGTIIVTGALRFTGGGAGNNIMGAVITGESADGDVLTGNVDINYCSTATESQTDNHALTILSWKEVLAE